MRYSNSATGENIKKYRRERKLTQKDLAAKIGKSESLVQKYEKGLVTIPLDTLFVIAEVLCVPIYNICGFGENPYPAKPIMRVGEMVEILISIHNSYKLTDKEDDALCEACNILDRLPRMSTIDSVKEKLEGVAL